MIRALIFDCDGVIADTEPAHYAMFNRVLKIRGYSMTREEYDRRYLALNDRECFTAFSVHHGLGWSRDAILKCAREKARHYGGFLANGRLKIYPGVRRFVRVAAGHVPLAVYSGALKSEVKHILRSAGLNGHFRAIVASDDVARGKPHPEGYRKALDRLNRMTAKKIHSHECLVVEDSPPGLESARKAGMRSLAVTNSYAPARLHKADWIVRSLSEVTWEDILERFPTSPGR
ncbi:MAG: HAD family phosphatase [Nitrospirae bacterium]|nr:HAD family phosphatase [Nitrospirota bacterium]